VKKRARVAVAAERLAGVRSGLFVPLFDEVADPAVVAGLSAEAEVAGWQGVLVRDNLRFQKPVVDVADPWMTLAAMAAATTRSRFGPMVTPLARRLVDERRADLADDEVVFGTVEEERTELPLGA
jgi:alkanesulfonate monooxygenase SsuD/methylene tetrahydromethanopterin reductase-like flavin-dependent oxidoreductase (luciferase family)